MRATMALAPILMLAAVLRAGAADGISSAYTDLDTQRDCVTFAAADESEGGDWANLICPGYKGYPVLVYYSDARESLFYGFPPGGDIAPNWEGFSAFNATGPKIEWRIVRDGNVEIPFATIHRWFVSASPDSDRKTEVLAVEKVGQPGEQSGCTVGLVVASGNPDANEQAREIADERARYFDCGNERRIVVEGSVPLPDFVTWER